MIIQFRSEMTIPGNIKIFHILFIMVAACCIWIIIPTPEGLTAKAWHMLIVFISTMIGIMLEIIPLCGTLFLSLAAASLTGTIDLKTQGFTGFSNIVPWLLFFILALSKSITKSTIGLRIAYFFVKVFGKNVIGLAYSLSFTELTLSTILPSNTARGASVGLPVVSSLAKYISSALKGISEKTIGTFLTLVYTSANSVCSSMFLTAMISNAIIVDIAERNGISLTWLKWASHTVPACLLILLTLPLILYFLTRPKVMDLTALQKDASEKIKKLGALSVNEKCVLYIFCGMLVLWILAEFTGINIITTTLIGIVICLILGIFTVKDVLSDQSALSAVIMLGVLISYVNCMSEYGTIEWFNGKVGSIIAFCPEKTRLYVLSVIYFMTHYFFSGEGARIIALYPPFVLTGLALGIDKLPLVTTLAVFSAFSDMLAHYTCPVSILMFSNGYVSVKKWMAVGCVISIISITIWFVSNSLIW